MAETLKIKVVRKCDYSVKSYMFVVFYLFSM